MKKENKSARIWIYKRIKGQMTATIILSLVAMLISTLGIGLALATKLVFDVATGESDKTLAFAGIVLFLIIALQMAARAVQSYLSAYIGGKLTVTLREYLFGIVCRKKYKGLSSYHSGDLLNRFTSDTDIVISNSVSIIVSLVSISTKIIIGIAAMLLMEPLLAVLVLVFGVFVPAAGRFLNKKYKKLHAACQGTEGETRSFLQECFENIVVIKSFVSEGPFAEKLQNFLDKNFKVKMKRATLSVIMHICLYSFFTLGYYAILVWGANGIARGTLTYGTLMAFLQLVIQLRAPLQNVSGIMPKYYSAISSAERLIEIENLKDEEKPSEKLEQLRAEFDKLELKSVTFSYDGEEILSNCDFTAQSGKITAITGESGIGKSTVFKLLLGLYEPSSGEMKINGEADINASLRGLFAYVPQGNLIISGTIRDNLTLCNPEKGEDEIIKALKTAEIYDFIKNLPNGIDTQLSERGMGLSEGQVQRISIARALLSDAPVLLLDEATSGIDEQTETAVLKNIREISGKTVIFITHRNTSLKICDNVVRIENKKITEVK